MSRRRRYTEVPRGQTAPPREGATVRLLDRPIREAGPFDPEVDIVIAGSGHRDYVDETTVFRALDAIRSKLRGRSVGVVQGGARGADSLVQHWAQRRGLQYRTVWADWCRYGKAAGPIRNREMIARYCPDVVVAFKDDNLDASLRRGGTEDMVSEALRRRIPVHLYSRDQLALARLVTREGGRLITLDDVTCWRSGVR